MGRVTDSTRIRTVRVREGRLYAGRKSDHVAVEEPLDIRLNGQQLSLTMRTPGNDVELIHGFLHGEGIIRDREDISEARYCDGAVVDEGNGFAQNTYNVMDFTTTRPQLLPLVTKNFTTTSACGVCGSESIDAVRQKSRYTLMQTWTVTPQIVLAAARALSDQQAVFARTGGVHAAALVDLEGNLLVVREDVGRHNAVDKVIGWALLEDRLPLRDCFLLVSSRASFEITQKAYMAGIPMLACVSAASSLAVDTAEEFGMTLLGFTRAGEHGDGRMNLYTHPERIDLAAAER
ncbi:formate dehydrogenase accessory sulfurtransferase FdhD [Brachybacterium aquaticum]|uniref:Sulfur carrier protein FdhD n=1 Tax=Brachybacterium aquaticum TaxID=1432564 RepID=A0A841AIU2_9MICO|nr:formate dehydrogenase accessory sulfurtransferase FdhD [Brachybacterium aquaticum]MBB5833200.1 FdhD protein [Brachybacterium aquaticum]